EGISIEGINTQRLVLKNEGMATAADFEEALQNVHFLITEADPLPGERVVACVLYANGEISDTAKAFIQVDLNVTPYAGEDAEVEVCEEGLTANLLETLGENALEGGYWYPELTNTGTLYENIFNTYYDDPGTYYYIVQQGNCEPDTAEVEVILLPKPLIKIDYDPIEVITLCQNDTLIWDITHPDIVSYLWENGMDSPIREITEAGSYFVEVIDVNACTNFAWIDVEMREESSINITEGMNFCQGEVYEWEGSYLEQDTSLCSVFPRDNGCDSTHCLQLTFHPTYQFYDTYTFCDEGVDYLVEGVKVERDTSFCAYYTSSQACDSIRCVEVVFEPLPQEEEWVEMCRGESYEWQGQALDNDTTFCLTYTGSNGCDSTWCLNLEFSESYVFYDSYNFCQDGA
ncbi:MAG: hypothetical protein GY751_14590, partial [Bacteroidetes bacterium]|nr:hypothetical protein [Bacteroidota bacterium]